MRIVSNAFAFLGNAAGVVGVRGHRDGAPRDRNALRAFRVVRGSCPWCERARLQQGAARITAGTMGRSIWCSCRYTLRLRSRTRSSQLRCAASLSFLAVR
eukprot:COSAG01_NODE_758_length_13805_cov_23.267912_4_plen_100_part_00